jgi:dienelactone hydrolase
MTGRRQRGGCRGAVALVAAGLAATLAGCSSGARHRPAATTVAFPNTPAGDQARWLFGAVTHLPIPTSEVTAHFDATFLSHIPPPAAAALNTTFAGLTSLKLDSITTSTAATLVFTVTANAAEQDVSIAVDARGLISGLRLAPVSAPPASAAPSVSPTGVRSIPVGVGSPPLTATLTLPAHASHVPAVVLVGGSGPNDQDEAIGPDKPFLDLADGLAADGIATLRYDKRTLDYPSSIDAATFTPTQEYVPDAVAAVNLLRARPEIDPTRIFVLGHSQGGTFAPLIAKTDPQIAGVILLAAGSEPFGPDLVRQLTYLATLPGSIGAGAKAQLPAAEQAEQQIDSPNLASEPPSALTSPLLGGAGPAYFLNLRSYNEVATARAIPQPILILQGDRDYQVTVADDLSLWLRGLAGRAGVTVHQYPQADHLFIDGTGPPTPADYDQPAHVDPAVIADIAAWISGITG